MTKWIEDLNMAIDIAKKSQEKSDIFLDPSLCDRSNSEDYFSYYISLLHHISWVTFKTQSFLLFFLHVLFFPHSFSLHSSSTTFTFLKFPIYSCLFYFPYSPIPTYLLYIYFFSLALHWPSCPLPAHCVRVVWWGFIGAGVWGRCELVPLLSGQTESPSCQHYHARVLAPQHQCLHVWPQPSRGGSAQKCIFSPTHTAYGFTQHTS